MTNIDPPPQRQFNHRRIFISEDKRNFQIFSFSQKKDGSIYCNWPDFINTSWLVPILGENGPELKTINSVETGKLSIHGKGMCAFRPHDNAKNRPLIIKGNKLLDLDKNEIGARHLFTAFPKEPSFQPTSPLFNRPSDYPINTPKLEPFVIIFFAIPKTQKGLELEFQSNFSIDDIETIPPVGGWGVIELKLHNVFWYIYRTKHMNKWPKKSQIIFHDGCVVPFFIGTGVCQFRLELRNPKYHLSGNKLLVKIENRAI